MKQAVVTLAGKQYIVAEGESLSVDKHVEGKEGENFVTDQVLLITNDSKTTVGAPLVKDASVSFKIQKIGKAQKVVTARFRAKSRYRRTVGHRQPQTVLEVTSISFK